MIEISQLRYRYRSRLRKRAVLTGVRFLSPGNDASALCRSCSPAIQALPDKIGIGIEFDIEPGKSQVTLKGCFIHPSPRPSPLKGQGSAFLKPRKQPGWPGRNRQTFPLHRRERGQIWHFHYHKIYKQLPWVSSGCPLPITIPLCQMWAKASPFGVREKGEWGTHALRLALPRSAWERGAAFLWPWGV